MANDARRVGSQFETDLVGYARGRGLLVERLARAGANDEGDLVLDNGAYIVEAKARRDAKSSLNLNAWLIEAHTEAQNYARARNRGSSPVPVLIVKNPRHSIGKAFVVMYLEDFIESSD